MLLFSVSTTFADIVMGVVPQQSPLKLLKVWSPIAEHLTKQLGEKVVFKTEKSIPEFEKVLYSGGYDFAYMNPYHYVVAHKKQGYVASVRAIKDIKGILVMQKGKSLQGIANEKNTRYLFPAPFAFAATLLTKYELLKHYKIDLKNSKHVVYVNSHDSVYKGVSRGFGRVGGGIVRTYKNLNDEQTKSSLEIVYETQSYPSHPFAIKADVKNKEQIAQALMSIPQELLQNLSIKALKKIDDDEYKSVKELAEKLEIMP